MYLQKENVFMLFFGFFGLILFESFVVFFW